MSAASRQQFVEELRDDAILLAKAGMGEPDIWIERANRMRKTGLDNNDIRTKLTATSGLLEVSEPWHAYWKSRASGLPNSLAEGPSEPKGKAPAHNRSFETIPERPASLPNAELEELRRQVEIYQLQLAEARAAARQPTLPFAEPLHPHRMPDPEPFDGEYKDYRRWKFQMITVRLRAHSARDKLARSPIAYKYCSIHNDHIVDHPHLFGVVLAQWNRAES